MLPNVGELTDVVANLRFQFFQKSRFFIVLRLQNFLIRGQEFVEMGHPHLHIVLKELWNVLVVEIIEDFGDLDERTKDDAQGIWIGGVLFGCKILRGKVY